MSDPGHESAGTGESRKTAPERPEARRSALSRMLPGLRGRGGLRLALAGVLLLVIALVASGPLWVPLLPWGAHPPAQNGMAPPPREALGQPPNEPESAALRELDRRVGALEKRPSAAVGDIAEIRQQLATLTGSANDLATRIAALDNAVRNQIPSDPTDIALVLALLQIRDAVEVGRPFAAAYDALAGLAGARPEVAAAAAPLAEPAKTGLAGRSVLARRLHELAGAIAVATPSGNPPPNTGSPPAAWTEQALARVRGLVTIRRIGEPTKVPSGGPAAAVTAAERALAGGDLAGAVDALGVLTGVPAEAASPWLRMARERLAAETALQKIEALLVARLGTRANALGSAGPPR